MKLVYLTKNDYIKWDYFCLNSKDTWFWHTTAMIDFIDKNHLGILNIKNKSFYIEENNEIVAICPLFIEETSESIGILSGGSGNPGAMPAIKDNLDKEKYLKFIFSNIDKIAFENNADYCKIKISSLISFRSINYNFLMKYHFLNCSLNSNIIDTSKKIILRKSYKSLINKYKNIFKLKIVDKSSYNKSFALLYEDIYTKAVGKRNKPIEFFLDTLDWVENGNATIFFAEYNSQLIGYSFILYYKDSAYYLSGAVLPEFENLPVTHFIQNEVINWLYLNKINYYEIGFQFFSDQIYNFPTDKEKSISFFKRGFGGENYSFYIGEKFYNKDYFLKTYISRINHIYKT